jgi:phage terminase large subunit-like protein
MSKEVDFYIDKNIVEGFYKTSKRYIVAYGGRGSGKTMQFAALCILYMMKHVNSRILAIRGSQNKLSESSLQTLKDVVTMMGVDDYFIITENTLRCKNGSEALFYGARNHHSFKSLQRINLVFIDEATELTAGAWQDLIPTIRADDSRFLISFNPELEEDWVYQNFIVNKHPEAYVIKLNWQDNPFFPSVLRVELEYDKKRDILKYEHIWEGKLRKDIVGALWNKDMIIHKAAPRDQEYDKILVSIDPSVTNKATSDACGLIVAGKVSDKEYHILNDATAIMSPKEWAMKAIALYRKYEANYIVYESNQGGDLIKTVIRDIDPSIRCVPVHARRSKTVRAEEILYLYEAGYVTHTKHFTTLEYEMVTFTGDKKDKSPNSLDAMVHGLKSLSPNKTNNARNTRPAPMGKSYMRLN